MLFAGFHPYFIGNHSQNEYMIPSAHYFDYSDSQTKKYTCELNELPIHDSKMFSNLTDSIICLKDARYTLQIQYSNQFKWAIIWSEQANEYICVEPWMAGPLGFDSNPHIIQLPAGEKLQAQCSFTIKKN